MTKKEPKKWIHYPVSDWTDYLDKGATVYERDGALYDFVSNEKIRDLSREEITQRKEARRKNERGRKGPTKEVKE